MSRPRNGSRATEARYASLREPLPLRGVGKKVTFAFVESESPPEAGPEIAESDSLCPEERELLEGPLRDLGCIPIGESRNRKSTDGIARSGVNSPARP